MSDSDLAISVRGLSKAYTIAQDEERHSTLTETALARLKDPICRPKKQTFWALKDVSFDIKKGDVVGIIGRNGAGKSTLLKIMSRITEPTKGEIDLYGRVGSLLEVGTGFHPELTGRENIYLNGQILGMRKKEIDKYFDAIVDFAEVEKFIDTPVKRYSSGMYVRLAFAVAAHLDPEILIVDEVLAVGDASFQKKCLCKLGHIAGGGRTVLFVSHNMAAIARLCQSAVFLDQGRALGKCSTDAAILEYSRTSASKSPRYPITRGEITVHEFQVTQDGTPLREYDSAKPIDFYVCFETHVSLNEFRIGIFLKSSAGDIISRSLLADWNPDLVEISGKRYELRGSIPSNFLLSGKYVVELHCSRFGIVDYSFEGIVNAELMVNAPKFYNAAYAGERTFGQVLLNGNWRLSAII